uniref:DUF4218 domain-containing protein n=1 Tax=Arundo donax TaxID=35708 RepID=A0A0A9DBE1_ARUDO
MERNIVVHTCKLEKISPQVFFNPMQHLIIHLAEEVRLRCPIQYWWNYAFERAIQKLRKKYGIRQELRVTLLKLSLLRRP